MSGHAAPPSSQRDGETLSATLSRRAQRKKYPAGWWEAGSRRTLHVILIPEELAVQRVLVRVETGGHAVPEEKIRARCQRLWRLIREAITLVEEAEVLDNSRAATPFRVVARYASGALLRVPEGPAWTPEELC